MNLNEYFTLSTVFAARESAAVDAAVDLSEDLQQMVE